MFSKRIIIFALVFVLTFAGSLLSNSIFSLVYSTLIEQGIPPLLIELFFFLLFLIFFLEIVVRFLIWQALPPLQFVSTQPEDHESYLNQGKLASYTNELQALGFVHLMDYTSPTLEGIARLLGHPQQLCFAEVSQVKNSTMFCSLSSPLEENWILAVSNLSFQTTSSALMYAFFSRPRTLIQYLEDASPNFLFPVLLSWREEVSQELGVEPLSEITPEFYLEQERKKRIEIRQSLLRQSIILKLLKALQFLLNPKSEWLGEYQKIKSQ